MMCQENMFNELFLCNFCDNIETEDLNTNLHALWSGKWLELIDSELIREVYRQNFNVPKEAVSEDVLSTFIAALCAFVQANYTGPDLKDEYREFLEKEWPKDVSVRKDLAVDSECVNPNTSNPELLLTAKYLIDHSIETEPCLINKWWKMRYIYVHQKILEELTNSLYEEFKAIVDDLMQEKLDSLSKANKCLLLLEISQGYLLFKRVEIANKYLNDACECLAIEANVEGFLGFRTKFQQKALPQLLLKVNIGDGHILPSSKDTHGNTTLPKLLRLDDDVRLEKITFVDASHNEIMNIPALAQIIVLTKGNIFLNSQPKDVLCDEEFLPYITTLLHQHYGPLFVRIRALLFNIKLDACHQRTIDRSLRQCEEVLKIVKERDFDIPGRFSYVFSSLLRTRWEIQEQCGDIMMSLGLVKTALDLYLKIQSWENVIDCYTRLDLRHKAAEIIRQELEKEPTATLYCLLGDATDDEKCYEQAWEFSGSKSSRAQRHWGNFYFAKSDYAKAIPHYEKSLEINALQENIWLRLGYAALMEENWKLASQAYIRYTHLEPGTFESWNNLAKALIKLGDKKKAHTMLKESLKCNYDNWKIWENFMIVSIDTGHFEDVINSYNRLIELKQRYLDIEILKILCYAIASGKPDANGQSSERLAKKCLKLLGHVCIHYPNEYDLWKISAKVPQPPLSRAQKLQKAYKAYTTRNPTWHDVVEYTLELLNLSQELCEYSMQALNECELSERTSSISQLSSARLSAQACVRITEAKAEKTEEIYGKIALIKDYVEQAAEKLKTLR